MEKKGARGVEETRVCVFYFSIRISASASAGGPVDAGMPLQLIFSFCAISVHVTAFNNRAGDTLEFLKDPISP